MKTVNGINQLTDAEKQLETELLKRWSCIHYVRSEKCCNITKHTCKGSTCGKWDVGLMPDGIGHFVKAARNETR